MKKIYAFFTAIIIGIYCYAQFDEFDVPGQNDNPLSKIAQTYFRSNPYIVHFSTFLNHLMNDPTLTNKTIVKRTDTTLFFFKGDYTTHNPFGFKTERTEIRLAEQEIVFDDSAATKDTVLFYQLIGYTHDPGGVEAVRKEFSKFDHKYGKKFFFSNDKEFKKGDEVTGIFRNYFVPLNSYSPLAISWATLDDKQNIFTILFRIKVSENIATLPAPPDSR